METLETLKQRVEDKVLECLCMAEKHFGCTLSVPVINYRNLGVIAGKCKTTGFCTYTTGCELIFNPILLQENTDEFIGHIIPHEIGHLLVKLFYRRAKQSHGPEFRSIMRNILKSNPSTYHNLDVSNCGKKVKRWIYKCNCRTHTVSTRKHHQLKTMNNRYSCMFCRGRLSFVSEKS
jgi:SprT protein